MKKMLSLYSTWLAACLVAGFPYMGPQAAPVASGFPDSLLEGKPEFNLAILLQGDIRGSFGPCG
jgi:hypothetical protein